MAFIVLFALITIFISTYVLNKRVPVPIQIELDPACQTCHNQLCSHKQN